ncbi:hypothetical protein M3Y97_00941200 [Aphelenchoides bicaudatus]|nr:hypothetical protein M3Y97_00941200 [Aphelenchoides bicaudatus]
MRTSFFISTLLFAFGNALPLDSINNKDTLTCNSVTVYYTGLFHHQQYDGKQFNARFQLRYDNDIANQRVFLTHQRWDLNLSTMDFYFTIFNNTVGSDCTPLQQGCSINYNAQNSYIASNIHRASTDNVANLFYEPNPANGFTLKNVIGQCTSTLAEYPDQKNKANPNWYRVCACCGNYDPHPDLLCPDNPWQTHTVAN